MRDDALISAMLEDQLGESERAAFWQRIATEPAFADRYAAASLLEADLLETPIEPAGRTLALSPRERAGVRASFKLAPAAWSIAAAILIAAGAVAIYVATATSEPAQPAPRIAVLTGATGGVLIDPEASDAVRVGDRVAAGGYEFSTGRIEVALDSGTEVAISGPAHFRFDSSTQTTLTHGRLSAIGKPGYVVRTPRFRIVDLGTAFSVNVDEAGVTHVECYRGRVAVQELDADGNVKSSLELTAWKALTAGPDRQKHMSTASFAGLADLPTDDPMDKLVAWYPFEGDARNGVEDALHASEVSSVQFVDGRDGAAARFAGSLESFIDLPIDATPESMPRLTWGAWVRPSALAGSNREVLSTDFKGFRRALTLDPRNTAGGANPNDPNHKVGAFAGRRGVVASTGPAPQLDQWRFVAAVYDAKAQTVTVYTDDPDTGRLVATSDSTIDLTGGRPVIRVGNHFEAQTEAFAGLIDDVFVIADALSTSQLQTIHAEGFDALDIADAPEPSDASASQETFAGGTADRP